VATFSDQLNYPISLIAGYVIAKYIVKNSATAQVGIVLRIGSEPCRGI
jgi:hypothetical protein